MVKGDTLWALSERYLKDPYLWPQITYLDGTAVSEPRRMPIGTLLLIPSQIANERALLELPSSEQESEVNSSTLENESQVQEVDTTVASPVEAKKAHVSNPSIASMVARLSDTQKARLWNYYLTHNDGLVRAYHNGREVVIEVQILIDEMRHQQGNSK
jgi:hypothetical protein